MQSGDAWVVVGLDNGGNKNNATVLDAAGRFLVDELLESPSRVTEGPDVAVEALVLTFEDVLRRTKIERERVRAVGLDTPGPASAEGVISSKGSTNFSHPGWRSYDFRGALEKRLSLPVVYNNDGNAAALYATAGFGPLADKARRSPGRRHRARRWCDREGRDQGAAGFAGELGHPRPDGGP
jgi:predicted NBD/HSP70 family sugar kinase